MIPGTTQRNHSTQYHSNYSRFFFRKEGLKHRDKYNIENGDVNILVCEKLTTVEIVDCCEIA